LRLQPCLALLLAALAMSAQAQGGVRRCIGANGEPVFSDRPCKLAPVPERGDDIDYALPLVAPMQTCPTSPQELRDRVAAAFDGRNAIALSGLMLWDGYGRGDATATLRELARLIEEPLITIELDQVSSAPWGDPYARRRGPRAPMDTLLIVRTARDLDRVPHEARTSFEVVDHRGCWWLRLVDW